MNAHPVTPLVRVPWNEPGIIGKVLDGGDWGAICPMVNTSQEAKALASACLYPASGKRSNGPIRAAMYGEASTYQSVANEQVLIIPMIETQEFSAGRASTSAKRTAPQRRRQHPRCTRDADYEDQKKHHHRVGGGDGPIPPHGANHESNRVASLRRSGSG
jgi:hypothetical protein